MIDEGKPFIFYICNELPKAVGEQRRAAREIPVRQVACGVVRHSPIAGTISRGWKAGVKALDREAASAGADGLDSGRASATLLLFGECLRGSGLHAHSKTLSDLVFVGWPLLEGLLDGL